MRSEGLGMKGRKRVRNNRGRQKKEEKVRSEGREMKGRKSEEQGSKTKER